MSHAYLDTYQKYISQMEFEIIFLQFPLTRFVIY